MNAFFNPKRLAGRSGPLYLILGLVLFAALTAFQGGSWTVCKVGSQVKQQVLGLPNADTRFSEADFLRQKWFLADRVGVMQLEDNVTQISARRDIVWDRFHTDLWRLETEFLKARLRSLNADLISLPADEQARQAPPACTRNESSRHAPWRERRKIYDVFLFLDEYPLIEIRLNELADVVDVFVIMQCPVTFMNHSKPMPDPTTFPELAKVKHKIKRLFCDLDNYPYDEPSPWKREEHMRYHAIKQATEFIGNDDILMLGDLDELVDGGALSHLAYQPDSAFPVTFYVPLYRSSFGCIDRKFNGAPNLWPGTVATLGRLLKQKAFGHKDGNEMRDVLRERNTNKLWCAGWHCSSCMLEPEIATKLSEYSHAPEVDDNHKLPSILGDVRETCLFGFYERRRTLKGLPKYVLENSDKYKYLMPR